MEVSVLINKDNIKNFLRLFFLESVRYLYGWLITDGEILGYIIGVFHILIAISIPILAFLSHVVYPNVWFKLYVFICLFCIFTQHVFLNVCIMFSVEETLTKQKTIFYPIIEKILDQISLTVSQFITYIVIAEGFTTLCFGLELLSEFSRFVYKCYGIDI